MKGFNLSSTTPKMFKLMKGLVDEHVGVALTTLSCENNHSWIHVVPSDQMNRTPDNFKSTCPICKASYSFASEWTVMIPDNHVAEMRPIDPDAGDLMTLDDFRCSVTHNALTNDDGYGELATVTHVSDVKISPSNLAIIPCYSWATHVMWYNK